MKIYLVGYEIKPEFKVAQRSGETIPNDDTHDIFYNEKPLWTFPYKEFAETELRIMLPMRVHVGSHYCQLEVKQVAEDKYAIVCNDHPEKKATA
jgi:hypothetical protein